MSTRAIAPIVGASKSQVAEDIADCPEVDSRPAKVTSLDGRERPAKSDATPRRNPLPEQIKNAGWELRKSVERLQRLATDDRFNANKEAMASHMRGHLTNAIEVCQDLLDRIDN